MTWHHFCSNPDCDYYLITDKRVHALVEYNLHAKGRRPKPNGLGQNAVENWQEIVRSKIETVSFEQALDDVRLFIGSSEDIDLQAQNNLLSLLK